jgi:hypothetical protein
MLCNCACVHAAVIAACVRTTVIVACVHAAVIAACVRATVIVACVLLTCCSADGKLGASLSRFRDTDRTALSRPGTSTATLQSSVGAAALAASLTPFVPLASSKLSLSTLPLSVDQRPDRPDEKIRLAGSGGRVEAYKLMSGSSASLARVFAPDVSTVRLAAVLLLCVLLLVLLRALDELACTPRARGFAARLDLALVCTRLSFRLALGCASRARWGIKPETSTA